MVLLHKFIYFYEENLLLLFSKLTTLPTKFCLGYKKTDMGNIE